VLTGEHLARRLDAEEIGQGRLLPVTNIDFLKFRS